jgi:1-aminocyclopropane-1-carboxylate deaminase/D-cysteine desulfhydrase-like pyridoxal-dependent ACC family enzyme
LYVKREDLADIHIGGNKWRKLKYNLIEARNQRKATLITFGGAWSNHIAATAAAGKRFGFNTIGVIRGEAHDKLNPTLQFASDCGMQLDYVDRVAYRNKTSTTFIKQLQQRYGDFYLLPEGGSNQLALKGCAEIVTDIETAFDIITVACGTGATFAGIASALHPDQHAIGFAVLKGAGFLDRDVDQMLADSGMQSSQNWHIEYNYHFGGYARTSAKLFTFIKQFKSDFGIDLDAVYTGKMFYGLFDMIIKGRFDKGTRIIAVHTGGVQGNAGFPELSVDQRNS